LFILAEEILRIANNSQGILACIWNCVSVLGSHMQAAWTPDGFSNNNALRGVPTHYFCMEILYEQCCITYQWTMRRLHTTTCKHYLFGCKRPLIASRFWT